MQSSSDILLQACGGVRVVLVGGAIMWAANSADFGDIPERPVPDDDFPSFMDLCIPTVMSPNPIGAAKVNDYNNSINSPPDKPPVSCEPLPDPPPIPVGEPFDPNDISGPEGFGDAKWLAKNKTLRYSIRFENDSTLASAPAQVVTIMQKLDSTIDARSFRLDSFGFGNFTFAVPENTAFYNQRLDVSDSLGVFVDVNAGIDITKNEAFWIFKSVDPATGELSLFKGFLPVNEPVDTPSIFNTIDAEPPTSRVNPLPAKIDSSTFTITWSGQDDLNGSGIRDYALFVSENDQPFQLHECGIRDTLSVFSGEIDSKYKFYTVATDNAGNVEMKSQADDSLIVSVTSDESPTVPTEFALYPNYPNPFNPITNIRYDLPKATDVKLVIYNILGQRVKTLIDKKQPAGFHTVQWDGKNGASVSMASGVYIYRIETKSFVKARKMLLLVVLNSQSCYAGQRCSINSLTFSFRSYSSVTFNR